MFVSLIESNISKIDEMKIKSCRQDVESQTSVTSVSTKTFMSLQNLIIQRNVHALDETSKQNLSRHLQKCIKAFQKFSAQNILQKNRIQFLITINNEIKIRRSTKSLMLRKTKIINYENLEKARTKRVVKDFA